MYFPKIFGSNSPISWLKVPNDRIDIYITPSGRDVITQIDTSEVNATVREYYKKDGKPGKKIIIFKEPW